MSIILPYLPFLIYICFPFPQAMPSGTVAGGDQTDMCDLCGVKLRTASVSQAHFQGKRHWKQVVAYNTRLEAGKSAPKIKSKKLTKLKGPGKKTAKGRFICHYQLFINFKTIICSTSGMVFC